MGAGDGAGQGREALPHRLQIWWLIARRAKHLRQGLGWQPPQQQVGIGDRGRPATPIGGGPWIGAGGFGSHPQPLAIEINDRTAAGGHRMHRQHRRLQSQAGDFGFSAALPGRLAPAGIEVEYIGGGAAHVETHDRRQIGATIGQQCLTGHRHRPHHAAGGTRKDRVLGVQQGWRC